MKKENISYLSASIFIIYGIFSQKMIFIGLGMVLAMIGLANHYKNKGK